MHALTTFYMLAMKHSPVHHCPCAPARVPQSRMDVVNLALFPDLQDSGCLGSVTAYVHVDAGDC